MKKTKKVLLSIFTLILIISNRTVSYGFAVKDMEGTTFGQETKIETIGQDAVKILTTIGSVCSVIVLIIIGIKYMLGSVEEKAEYKKTLFPYAIGSFLVFGASILASTIYNIAINL